MKKPIFGALKTRAVSLGIADRVRFVGQRADVPQLMAAADIFCQPTRAPEPFGLVFVEALSQSLPVVTFAMGGPAEIVDETCGVLLPPGRTDELASPRRASHRRWRSAPQTRRSRSDARENALRSGSDSSAARISSFAVEHRVADIDPAALLRQFVRHFYIVIQPQQLPPLQRKRHITVDPDVVVKIAQR